MTRKQYHNQLRKLKEDTITMGNIAKDNVLGATISLKDHDPELAKKVIEAGSDIDELYAQIEDTCFALLALQQPMARDLRMIGAILKINIDVERIGDIAFEIAKITIATLEENHIKPLVDIPRMAEICSEMLASSMEAFENSDDRLARKIAKRDNEVDALFDQVRRELITYMIEDPKTIKNASHLTFVARYLERCGDHITNICESIVYMATGERTDLN
ncbi:phosphate transport system regulatory protein PhoU [Methanosarcinales archaeon ex4572_44]|nr:MAG: phosphate transport system regulatory protein PhoU [Methanosarcinales archaeon ex4484_138]PHP45810.1 MAG: phosphate transport system regulatory protein PhoU [Methanosarcinales archaeon ex4572_44]RLG23539.1 MAG: phosphate transport system regulatory protein PhoU [Methanosarcinales archaeon]RLG27829.1 MAG: phosphate transport system regulatory protein PhoU [Methanosarcinales archaeon]HHI30487.1 phosphate signaling complex protein PhoU [Candidatus Methanoperedenaceae archaeon]